VVRIKQTREEAKVSRQIKAMQKQRERQRQPQPLPKARPPRGR